MDGLALFASVSELTLIIGSKVEKIQQPEKDGLLISLHTKQGGKTLLISADPNNARVQLTSVKKESPMTAPAFCMLLRKLLTGARISEINQPNLDRIVRITFDARDELGDEAKLILIAEIMGRHSNIILTDEKDKIIDCIKRAGLSVTRVRTLLPGAEYLPPPQQDKKNPLLSDVSDFSHALEAERPAKTLSETFYGISPAVGEAMVSAFSKNAPDNFSAAKRIARFYSDMKNDICEAAVLLDETGSPLQVYPFIPNAPSKLVRRYESMSTALDAFYAEKDLFEAARRKTSSMRRILQNNVERLNKNLALFEAAMHQDGEIDQLRLYGELLTANMHSLPEGKTEAALQNYYLSPPETLIVSLDPMLSINANAQQYFKKYQKAKKAKENAAIQRDAVLLELNYLEGIQYSLDTCRLDAEISDIYDELCESGYIKKQHKKGKKPAQNKLAAKIFEAPGGGIIYVGSNNRQNDHITFKIGAPNDVWLHTKDIPGSHVVLKCGKAPDNEALAAAARLAAYYSKAGGGTNIAVDYTLIKYVKKIPGAKPGLVTYTNQKTIYVTSDKNVISGIITSKK